MMNIRLKKMTDADLPFVKRIYDYYTLHSSVVYFIEPVPLEEIRRMVPVEDRNYRSFLICDADGTRYGFCYFSRFKEKPAFHISVEVTIYLEPDCCGRGIGRQALTLMEPYIREGGFSNAVALISAENEASIRLFEKCGYLCCAEIKEVAEKFGKKLTLKMYQKLFS